MIGVLYLDIVNHKFSEPIRHHVSRFGIASVTNTGHKILSLESSSHSAVNTLGFSPAWSNLIKSLRLVTNELLGSFLDDNSFGTWDNHCYCRFVTTIKQYCNFQHASGGSVIGSKDLLHLFHWNTNKSWGGGGQICQNGLNQNNFTKFPWTEEFFRLVAELEKKSVFVTITWDIWPANWVQFHNKQLLLHFPR